MVAATGGEENPIEAVLIQARPRICRLVRTRIPDSLKRRVDVEDIVQETFAVAARRFDEYRQTRSVPVMVWLRGLAIERLIEATRRHQNAAQRSVRREVEARDWLNQSSMDLLQRWAVDSATPSRVVADQQRNEAIRRALTELPQRYREILVLRFFESLTIAEAAATLGCSVANAKVLQFRAIGKLESTMNRSPEWQSADRQI